MLKFVPIADFCRAGPKNQRCSGHWRIPKTFSWSQNPTTENIKAQLVRWSRIFNIIFSFSLLLTQVSWKLCSLIKISQPCDLILTENDSYGFAKVDLCESLIMEVKKNEQIRPNSVIMFPLGKWTQAFYFPQKVALSFLTNRRLPFALMLKIRKLVNFP